MSESVAFGLLIVVIVTINVLALFAVYKTKRVIRASLRKRPWLLLFYQGVAFTAMSFLYFPIISYASHAIAGVAGPSLLQAVAAGLASIVTLLISVMLWMLIMTRHTEDYLYWADGTVYQQRREFIVALAWVIAGAVILLLTSAVLLLLM